MKKTSKLTLILTFFATVGLFSSCAKSKTFNINGEDVEVEPYGWFDTSLKNDSIHYKVCAGNIFWDVVLSETIIVPILLTGDQFYEPVAKKTKK